MRYPSNKTEDTIYKGYRGILYPNKEQTVLIEKTFGCCRYVYNRFLDERRNMKKTGRLCPIPISVRNFP